MPITVRPATRADIAAPTSQPFRTGIPNMRGKKTYRFRLW
jgi:hypothetical protein